MQDIEERKLVAKWMGKDPTYIESWDNWNPEDNDLATFREWEEICDNMTEEEKVKFTRMIVDDNNSEGHFDNNEWALRFWLLFTRPSLMWCILIKMIKENDKEVKPQQCGYEVTDLNRWNHVDCKKSVKSEEIEKIIQTTDGVHTVLIDVPNPVYVQWLEQSIVESKKKLEEINSRVDTMIDGGEIRLILSKDETVSKGIKGAIVAYKEIRELLQKEGKK